MNHLQFWVTVAGYYRVKIEDVTARLYANDVSHISVETLSNLFEKYRRTPSNKFMPLPSWFLEQLDPQNLDPKDQGREISSRVVHAISKFGWPNPEEAKAYIGSIGWKIVERNGGWEKVCEMVGIEINESTFLAQTRDLAESMVKNQGHKQFDQPINFISRNEKKDFPILKGTNDLLKIISISKDDK